MHRYACQPPWYDDYLARDQTLSGQRIVRRDLECRGADTRPIVATRSVFCFGARIERFRQDEPRLDAEEPFPQPQPRREDRIAVRELRAGAHPIDSFAWRSASCLGQYGNAGWTVDARSVLLWFHTGGQPRQSETGRGGGLNLRRRTGTLCANFSTASLNEIERVARRSIQIQRFRGNLVVDDAERWEERD